MLTYSFFLLEQLEHANGFTIVGDILIGEFHQMYKKSQDRVRARYDFLKSGKTEEKNSLVGGKKKGKQKSNVNSIKGGMNTNTKMETSSEEVDVNINETAAAADGKDAAADNGNTKTKVSLSDSSDSSSSKQNVGGAKKVVRFGGNNSAPAPTTKSSRRASAEELFSSIEEKTIEIKEEEEISEGEESEEEETCIRFQRQNSMAAIAQGVDAQDGVLTETLISPSRLEGVRTMLQTSGVGRMKPNMLLLPTIPNLKNGVLDARDEDYTGKIF